jgi:cellobiose-specific phosphotransferase system component IIA
MWARQNAQSGNPAVHKLAAQKRVEGCEAMLEQAKQDLERAGQRARTATQEQPTTARVRLPDWMVHGCCFFVI